MPHLTAQMKYEMSMNDQERQIHENGKAVGFAEGFQWGRRAAHREGYLAGLLWLFLNNIIWIVFWIVAYAN